jgi:ABC-type Na+ efflux pump permease subunit
VIVARRELSVLTREKTIVLALAIQLFIAAFSSFLVVGLVSLYAPGEVEGYTVEVAVAGDASDDLLAAVDETDGITARTYTSETAARDAFDRGEVAAVQTAERRDGQVHVDTVAPTSNVRTTVVVVQLRETLRTYERAERRDRSAFLDAEILALPPEPRSSPYYGFTYTVLVPLLLFLPPFISGSVAVDTITEEIERGTLELLRVAPLSIVDIVGGKALAMTLLAPVQAGLWMLLLGLNGITIANLLTLLVLVTAITPIVVALGIGLGLALGKRRPAQLLYSVLALVIFGALIAIPEHPATTAAKLAVGSPELLTYGHVAGYVVVAAAVLFVGRRAITGVDPESF